MTDTTEPPQEPQAEKPKRNWRGWLKEYAVIVIGVLTALAAQQAVEWFSWRNQVQEARQAIATETAGNITGAIIRLRTEACVERRLNELAKILDLASLSGNLPPLGAIYMPPRRTMASGAWDGVLASQVTTHFPREQLARLGRVYNVATVWRTYSAAELESWGVLSTMTGPGRRLDPASEADLRKAISLARSQNGSLANLAFQSLRNVSTLNLPFSDAEKQDMAKARDVSLTSGKVTAVDSLPAYLICQSIGAAPPQYGQAPWTQVPGRAEEAMKMLPDLIGR